MIDLPYSLKACLQGYSCTPNTVGRSTADVVMFTGADETLFLKTDSHIDTLRREHDLLCWLDGKLPVPEVVAWCEDESRAYLLMTAAVGHMSCSNKDADIISSPMETTVELLADGLRMLQSVDIADCPFENRLERKLSAALYNIENGLVDMDDFENGNDFASPMELYHWLLLHQPAEELCFSHGDYCLPNVFIDGGHITGFIDVGNAGVADKWQDIALCVRSLGYNLFLDGRSAEKDKFTALLFDFLGFPPDWEKINYYILLDELF